MSYRIALIPGDGIGREVVPEGVRALKALSGRFKFAMEFAEFPYSCEHYLETGKMMPEDGLAQLRPFDAILLGAVGAPQVPDHVSLWGLLIPIRRDFRPVRESAAGAPAAGHPFAACRPHGAGHRLRHRAGEHRGRVLRGRRPALPGHGAGGRGAGVRLHPPRGGPHPALRLRASQAAGRRSTSPRPPSRTASSTPCPSGTNASAPSPKNSRT